MFWGTPSFFWDKKSTMILFENFKKHPPTPRVLLGLCSIKKVPAPPPPPPPVPTATHLMMIFVCTYIWLIRMSVA